MKLKKGTAEISKFVYLRAAVMPGRVLKWGEAV